MYTLKSSLKNKYFYIKTKEYYLRFSISNKFNEDI